jgi:AcrR family transcriptional regulator
MEDSKMTGKNTPTETTPAESNDRRQRRKAATRARIIEAALELLSKQEYIATTVEQITRAADIGKGTYFNYFASKEHLLNEVGESQMAIIREASAKTIAQKSELKSTFKEIFYSLSDLFASNPTLARNLILANLSNSEARKMMIASFDERLYLVGKLAAQGQKIGVFRSDLKAETIAFFFLQTYFGNLMYLALQSSPDNSDWLSLTFEQFWMSVSTTSQTNIKIAKSKKGKATNQRS